MVCYIEDLVISMFVKSRSALYRQIPRKYLYLQELWHGGDAYLLALVMTVLFAVSTLGQKQQHRLL